MFYPETRNNGEPVQVFGSQCPPISTIPRVDASKSWGSGSRVVIPAAKKKPRIAGLEVLRGDGGVLFRDFRKDTGLTSGVFPWFTSYLSGLVCKVNCM